MSTDTAYDPFCRGPFPTGVRTLQVIGAARFLAGNLEAALAARGVRVEAVDTHAEMTEAAPES